MRQQVFLCPAGKCAVRRFAFEVGIDYRRCIWIGVIELIS